SPVNVAFEMPRSLPNHNWPVPVNCITAPSRLSPWRVQLSRLIVRSEATFQMPFATNTVPVASDRESIAALIALPGQGSAVVPACVPANCRASNVVEDGVGCACACARIGSKSWGNAGAAARVTSIVRRLVPDDGLLGFMLDLPDAR